MGSLFLDDGMKYVEVESRYEVRLSGDWYECLVWYIENS